MAGTLLKLAAFTGNPAGGNPAGVWIGDQLPDEAEMQRIAAEVGFSETAFVAPASGQCRTVRYFSPETEVPFCGHATIATGVALAEAAGDGDFRLETPAGTVPVAVRQRNGRVEASLTSVAPRHERAPNELVDSALRALRWSASDLAAEIPPAIAFAGAWHLILAASSRGRLDELDYDFETLKALMLEADLVTLQLIWQQDDTTFHSRNPFPVGGVVEDPATGAAAAALGGYLRDANLIEAPATFSIRQGEVMGRPSYLRVDVPNSGGIVVSGTAVAMT